MHKGTPSIINRLRIQALTTQNKTSKERPSPGPSDHSGAEQLAFTELLAVRIHIKDFMHLTPPYAERGTSKFPLTHV
jgi:hypothetical protein